MYFYNAEILTMNEKNEIIRGWIKINNGIIEKIGKGEPPEKIGIDVNGDIIMPGFINGHTHIAMTLLRGYADDLPLMIWLQDYIWPAEGKYMDEDAVKLGTELGILEMLANGITTFCDMYFFTKSSVKIGEKIGIRGLFAEGIIDFPTPNKKNAEEAIEYVKESIEENKNNKLSKIVIAVHAPYTTSPEIIKKAAEIAITNDLLFTIHTAETEFEVSTILKKFKKTPIALLNDLIPENTKTAMAHMVHLNEEDMNIAYKRKFAAIHNPQSNLKLSSGIAKIQKMIEKGITVGIGTDGTASNNNLDIIDEMRTASMIAKLDNIENLKAEQVVRMATIEGAKALHIDNETGSIEIGKSADMIRISMKGVEAHPYYNNPYSFIVYALNSRDIIMTMVNGKILYENGKYKTLNKKEILNNVKDWSTKLNEEN